MKLHPPYAQKRWVRISCFALGIITPIVFFSMSHQPWKTNRSSILLLQNIVYPFETVVNSLQFISKDLWQRYIDLQDLKKENIELTAKVRQLEAQIVNYNEVQTEFKKLRELINFKDQLSFETVPAQVINTNYQTPFKMLRVTLPHNHQDFAIGNAVILSTGIVGKIIRLGDIIGTHGYADIQLITDLNSHIDVFVRRTLEHGILSGLGTNFCQLRFQGHEDIKIGDEIISSGLLNIFPKGLAIGKVVKISYSPDNVSQTIIVKPNVSFEDIQEVLLIKPLNLDIQGEISKK
mgnify:CR=1 FL=1